MVNGSDIKTEFFAYLYSAESNDVPRLVAVHSFPHLNEYDIRMLKTQVTQENVRRAVFDIGATKAPKPNGVQAIFFQSQ